MKNLIYVLIAAAIGYAVVTAMINQEESTARDIQSIIIAVNGGY